MEKSVTRDIEAKTVLKDTFGYDGFRLEQEDIIRGTLNGESSLVVMPTGGGKSICYQIPAILLDGLTLVISPLIALMQDQVQGLKALGVRAEYVNSTITYEEEQNIFKSAVDKAIDLLYLSPEKAIGQHFFNFLNDVEISLIAIDEAHCVSIWGNDFRPGYAKLSSLLSRFSQVPHIALTATADSATQKDIMRQLGMDDARLFVSSFERTNLSINVMSARGRLNEIRSFVKSRPNEPGIIYALSRKSTEQIAAKLIKDGIKADFYHGRMDAVERQRVQDKFLRDDIQVICATIAFGMGIDKSNIRWVIHYNLPKNIESYYQEIGRAGRDGLNGDTLLFYSYGDVQIYREFIDNSESTPAYKKVQISKLDRMLELCQGTSCRTNIILSYFGEVKEEPCGRCDICKNPPVVFDGTLIAQKALSACKRVGEKVNMGVLIDVLRGSHKHEIVENGYHLIKTYGAGKEIGYMDWVWYITQLLNQGILSNDFSDRGNLKLTTLSEKVLFEGKKVMLTTPIEREKATKKEEKVKNEIQDFDEELFAQLKKTRKLIAEEEGVPPYIVFSDKTLKSMAEHRPLTTEGMMDIPGVGQYKLDKYAQDFLVTIRDFRSESTPKV